MAYAYIGALGKLMTASGFEEVLIKSAVCASGSIDKVLSGRHYKRARHVINTLLEAIERLLLASCQEKEAYMHTSASTHFGIGIQGNCVFCGLLRRTL